MHDLPRISSGILEMASALTLTSAHQHGPARAPNLASAQSFGCPQMGQMGSRLTAGLGTVFISGLA